MYNKFFFSKVNSENLKKTKKIKIFKISFKGFKKK